MFKLYNSDCLEKLKLLEDKSVNLVLIDPPYNIKKAKWDTWKTVEEYVNFIGQVFLELQRVLKDNGSFYFFHNDFLQIVELQNYINKNTNFVFKQMLIWDKFNGSKWNQLNATVYSNGNRNYPKQAEYCLYYTFQDETGLKVVDNNLELYKPIRDYFRDERKKTNLSYKELNELMGVASNGGGMASNILTSYKKGWTFPTREKYELLQTTGICQKPYEDLRQEYEELRQEYEELRQKYEGLRYTFNNQGLPSVLQHEPVKQNGHITPKPTDILEKIIKTSSNEGDVVLDCFMGSGSTGVACMNVNRRFIGIELDKNYFNIAKQRIEEACK